MIMHTAIRTILWTTMLGILCLGCGVAFGQTGGPVVVLDHAGPLPPGFVAEKRDAVAKWTGNAAAIVFEFDLTEKVDWAVLRSGLFNGTSVYVIGERALGVVVGGLALRLTVPKFVAARVHGEGVSVDKRGTLFTGHLVSDRKPFNKSRALEWVRESVSRSRTAEECPTQAGWEPMPGKVATFEDPQGDGRELWQEVNFCRRKVLDRNPYVPWRVKLTSETHPEKDRKLSNLQTQVHKKLVTLSGRSRDCYGPGSVGQNMTASVKLNCPRPEDESSWSWSTGGTKIVADAPPGALRIDWQADYTRDSGEAKRAYQWSPGVQVTATSELPSRVRNEIIWYHAQQPVPPFVSEWEPGSP